MPQIRPTRLAPIHRPVLCAGAALMLAGCARRVDRFTVDRVVERALSVPDVDQACQIGAGLRSPLAALGTSKRPPHQAMLIAEFTAALCDEIASWDHELRAAQAGSEALGLSPGAKVAIVRDARLAADRSHTRAAARFSRAWDHGEAAFGRMGADECPRLRPADELPYMVALVSGLQVVLHDSAGGSPLGVPKETILDVARAAHCLDDAKWWYGPSGMQAAAWATIPGSGPEGVDPWEMLEEVAQKSDGTGIRVARALQVVIATNAGREDIARDAIVAHAAARVSTPESAQYALFDRYALLLSRHQSDLLWIAEEGHRTPVFGELPGADALAPSADPFAADPFAEPAPEPAVAPSPDDPPEDP